VLDYEETQVAGDLGMCWIGKFFQLRCQLFKKWQLGAALAWCLLLEAEKQCEHVAILVK